MKKIIQVLSLAFFLCTVQHLMAQHHPHHRGHSPKDGRLIEKFKEELKLTINQTKQIEEIQKKYHVQFQSLRSEEIEDRHVKHEKIQRLHKALKAEIAGVLTTEQKQILEEKKEQMKEKHLDHLQKRQAKKIELHEALAAYRAKNIKPVLSKQRAKLEASISAADKAKITELRPIFKEVKAKHQALRKSGERPSKQEREAMKALHETQKVHRETLRELAKKYDEPIGRLFSEIEEQHEQWKKEQQEIHEKYAPKHEGANRKEGRKRHQHKRGMHAHHHGEKGATRHKVHFLLLEPNVIVEPVISENAATEINIYPNPASTMNHLIYEVKTAGQVRIELRNDGGKVLQIVTDGFKEVGTYSIEVDLSIVKGGVYYYTITDGSTVISKKVIVSKS